MKTKTFTFFMILAIVGIHTKADSCTGITLKSKDGANIVARTVEWANGESPSDYIIVPRGYSQQSMSPDGKRDGMKYSAFFGYVGLASEEYVIEGLNENGLSAGLFYFPKFGSYPIYDAKQKNITISDTELVAWILGNFETVDDVVAALSNIRVVATDPRAETLHWRVADKTGRQIVIEYIDGIPNVHENKLGVLTNSPAYDWHITNLSNYIDLHSGSIDEHDFGNISIAPIGHGSGLLGLPGDVTPPSRFVRVAFYQTSAPKDLSTEKTVEQAFTILQAMTIPIGIQYAAGQTIPDIPSATQWTSVTDMTNGKLYYTTMYNPTIRRFDLNNIDFANVSYQMHPLDTSKVRPIVEAFIN
ncbi:MAG: choloylglycine hydrolase family protein [Alphaproteobacteria bacterium]|nr:choloylglycine hydrolase family protein [Alphaproteobacteria bacterium]